MSGMADLGPMRRVIAELARFNTAPDGGGGGGLGTVMLFGPGLVVDLPSSADELTQILVTVTENDTAWPVLSRLCKAMGWKMLDAETGQRFM